MSTNATSSASPFRDSAAPAAGGAGAPSADAQAVMRRLAETAISHERLPMLDIVFDKLSRMLTESFLHLVSTDVQVSLNDVDYIRFGDFIAGAGAPRIIAVIHAPEWDNSFIISIDTRLIFALAEVLLGAAPDSVREASGDAARTPTNIEMQIAKRIFTIVSERLGDAFETVAKVEFAIERLELNPQFAAIARLTSAAVEGDLSLSVAGVAGALKVIFPYTTLEPLKASLQQMFVGERVGRDMTWERHFERAVLNTELNFEAILHQQNAALNEILNWKPGDTITFDASAESEVRLLCDGLEFFRGPMGRKNGRIAAQVEHMSLRETGGDAQDERAAS